MRATPYVAHSDTIGGYSASTFVTQSDNDRTVDLTADSASREMAPLPAPHLSYDGSSPAGAAPDSWPSTANALATDPGSSTWHAPSGPASFETRESDAPTTSMLPSSHGSDTLSALDRAVDRRLRQVYGVPEAPIGVATLPGSRGGTQPAEVHTAPFWNTPVPPTEAPDAGTSASGIDREAPVVDTDGAFAVQAATKRSSGSPSHYDSVMGFLHTGASSAHTAGHNDSTDGTSDGLMPSEAATAGDNPVQGGMPMQLLSTPLATAESGVSTEKSSIHHPVDHLHAKEKEMAKKEAKRKARLLQARATSGGDRELGSLDFPRQESSTTDAGYSGPNPSGWVARVTTSGRSHVFTSTQMTSPLVTDSVESVGLAAALDLDEDIDSDLQAVPHSAGQHQKGLFAAPAPAPNSLLAKPASARSVRQTVSPGGIVIIHDCGSDGDAVQQSIALQQDGEVAREGGMHIKGHNEGAGDHGEYEESSGAHDGGDTQVIIDCSAPESVSIRYFPLLFYCCCLMLIFPLKCLLRSLH